MRAEALKGHLDTLLLAVVSGQPAHGYAVIEELRRRSAGAFDLPEGTVYPALHRLERGGLLRSRWDATAPRRRRVYELTAKGRRALSHGRGDWVAFTTAVEGVLA
jgi:PadR family transcriptional regulator PadR